MIEPKTAKPTTREESEAYATATDRDDNRCQRCLRNCGPIARDHRKERSRGGRTRPANLQCLGLGCHEWKTSHPKAAIDEGWDVPGWAEPEAYPARRYLHTGHGTVRPAWVLYDNEGGWREISDDEAERRKKWRD